MTTLYLIRHGETAWTRVRRFQGHTDTQLTPRGLRQAAVLGERLAKEGIDFCYSSPLQRAFQSAQVIQRYTKTRIVLDARLKELSFGLWEGKTSEELIKNKNRLYLRWAKGEPISPAGGETIPAFRKRIRSWFQDLIKIHPGKKIAVVTHGGPVKMIIYEALQLPYRSLWSFRTEPASISKIEIGRHYCQLHTLNDVSHLHRKRLGNALNSITKSRRRSK